MNDSGSSQIEKTLKEWTETLNEDHLARREYQALLARVELAEKQRRGCEVIADEKCRVFLARAEAAEADLETIRSYERSVLGKAHAAIAATRTQVMILREALEYYAHPDHYEEHITLGGTRQPGVLTEGGGKARAALKKIKTLKSESSNDI
jgi:hypothetical protein